MFDNNKIEKEINKEELKKILFRVLKIEDNALMEEEEKNSPVEISEKIVKNMMDYVNKVFAV